MSGEKDKATRYADMGWTKPTIPSNPQMSRQDLAIMLTTLSRLKHLTCGYSTDYAGVSGKEICVVMIQDLLDIESMLLNDKRGAGYDDSSGMTKIVVPKKGAHSPLESDGIGNAVSMVNDDALKEQEVEPAKEGEVEEDDGDCVIQ